MAFATVDGLKIAFDVIGDGERAWALTPGGRFTRHTPGLRELAAKLAADNGRVLIWDRPNCGESDVCFEGPSESEMQADALAALLAHLDMAPCVVAGGSAGARVSLLTVANHPEVASGLAVWWISGGVMGLLSLVGVYCIPNIRAAWVDGIEAVAALPEWADNIAANPAVRQTILDQDRATFIATMERWAMAYVPQDGQHVPGLPDELGRRIAVPTLVFRSGESDGHHTRATSEGVAALIPGARLVEPPWGDREWSERQAERGARGGTNGEGLFTGWPKLAPQLLSWASDLHT